MRLLALMVLAGAVDAGVAGPRYEDAESTVFLEKEKGTIVVQAKGKYHLNGEYPINFVPAGGGKKVTKDQMSFTGCARVENESCGASIPVPAPGKGMLAFAVCDPDICLIKKVPVAP